MCTCRCIQPRDGWSLFHSQPSRHSGGPALIFSRDEMAAFLAGAKDGEFDDYAG